jgi:hypothetical protein
MFSTKKVGLILTLAVLVTADAYLVAACSNTCCKQTNVQVKEDAGGHVTACYQYTNSGTSCHTCCGTGSVDSGYCTTSNCDTNQVCITTSTTYQFQVGSALGDLCSVSSAFNENTGCFGLGSTKIDETLCTCGPEQTNTTKCNGS